MQTPSQSASQPAAQDDALERLVHQALRDQPPRRAPADLQFKVLAAIQQRSARSWWRKDFAHWPLAARAAFVLASAVLVKAVVDASLWLIAGLDATPLVAELESQMTWMKLLAMIPEVIARHIPSLWIYAGVLTLAVAYATVFGVGAAAYRTLYANR